jgi:WD40 repeat protein
MSQDGEQVLSADISPDGDRIATASWSDGATIRLWSLHTGEMLAKQSADITAGTGYINGLNDQGVIEGLEWATWSVSFSTDGIRVITAAGDGAARIWDTGPCGLDLIEAAQTVLSRSGEKASVANRMVFWEIVPQ